MMMDGMMDCGPMMWGVGLIWLLFFVLLVLGIAALIKYLFFAGRKRETPRPVKSRDAE